MRHAIRHKKRSTAALCAWQLGHAPHADEGGQANEGGGRGEAGCEGPRRHAGSQHALAAVPVRKRAWGRGGWRHGTISSSQQEAQQRRQAVPSTAGAHSPLHPNRAACSSGTAAGCTTARPLPMQCSEQRTAQQLGEEVSQKEHGQYHALLAVLPPKLRRSGAGKPGVEYAVNRSNGRGACWLAGHLQPLRQAHWQPPRLVQHPGAQNPDREAATRAPAPTWG